MRRHCSLTLGYGTLDEHCSHHFGIVEPSGEKTCVSYFNFCKNISKSIIHHRLCTCVCNDVLVCFILCRYMKGADSSSEKDGEGSQDVAESISAEKVGISKTVKLLTSIVPSMTSNIAL